MKLSMKYTGLTRKNKIIILISAIVLIASVLSALCLFNKKNESVWTTNLRSLFIHNSAIIYSVNLRTFGAKDYNGNDIIEKELGEESGTFINAIPKLKVLKEHGINTIYTMPIMKLGKLNAKGTAGSVYAIDSFYELNPQLFDEKYPDKDLKAQAKKFVEEAHKNGLFVMVDIPGCGSYDMTLKRPELFGLDKQKKKIIPSNWTDVRFFNNFEEDGKTINAKLIAEHKILFDLIIDLGADGVRIDAAGTKPFKFWTEIIGYARSKNPNLFILAEASPEWFNPLGPDYQYLNIKKLMKAGFDGYYEDWSDMALLKSNDEVYKKIITDRKIIKHFKGQKAVTGTFATHDQTSPNLMGAPYWEMFNWLNCTLPINPFFLDGIPAGDQFVYKFQGKKPIYSFTDNEKTYDTRKGNIDLYNFSRAPYFLDSKTLNPQFTEALELRQKMYDVITSNEIEILPVDNPQTFAYRRKKDDKSVIVVGNLNHAQQNDSTVNARGLSASDKVVYSKNKKNPVIRNGKIITSLKPYEIQVFAIIKEK